jgi:hypothetical protein
MFNVEFVQLARMGHQERGRDNGCEASAIFYSETVRQSYITEGEAEEVRRGFGS